MIKLSTKKFSTAAFAVVLAMWGPMLLEQGGTAQAQGTSSSPMSSGSDTPARTQSKVFKDNAPDQHVVVKGDTLWGIAGKYLQKPWRWPEVWQMNRAQIKNPHWIYPGQIIILDKLHGTMHLTDGRGNTVVLEPTIRVETGQSAIPSIPQNVIEPFLRQALVVQDDELKKAPRIVGAKGDRLVLARGDSAYVSGITDSNIKSYQIYRPGVPLKDPDTGKILGYQADYVGSAQIVREGDPATVLITSFSSEISAGDRLIEAPPARLINYAPHAPEQPITGKIIDTYSEVGLAGRGGVVSLNRGSADGLDIGTILAVQSAGATITDTTNDSKQEIKLPDERSGLLFVFRLFDHISYALVLNSEYGVDAGDVFTQP
ncbi:MAG: LysM domain-containing protein [Burkholderiaceae bacterium]|jgi:hypothetical protein